MSGKVVPFKGGETARASAPHAAQPRLQRCGDGVRQSIHLYGRSRPSRMSSARTAAPCGRRTLRQCEPALEI